ncbi:MAG: NAD(P)/FAD-dependent oxidoreductase [Desulfobulbaceae bacterium]|nr:NAD(P)/FAD-dependent oxidoreductase [Desulfobulbaceae bacterium]
MKVVDVAIVGAGASGLMAAAHARAADASVLIVEKMLRVGRKLAISGKGRCNLTNAADVSEFIKRFGDNGSFLRQAFARFFRDELLAILREEGVETVLERGGRIFPASGRALDVVDALRGRALRLGARIKTDCPISAIGRDGTLFALTTSQGIILARTIILATGGASYPRTGSTGDGYRLAASLGHSVRPIRPALTPLCTAPSPDPEIRGLTLRNIGLTVAIQGKKAASDFGEVAFTDDGLAGPLILHWSGRIVDALVLGRAVRLSIDLKPALSCEQLRERLRRDARLRAAEPLQSVLRGLMAKEMLPVCLRDLGFSLSKMATRPTAKVTDSDWERIMNWLKKREYLISGHRPLAEALVTAGGVALAEVDPYTMQSRLIPGLYFAGEVLDIQADTGGYNLQAAFSTGAVAGTSAAEQARRVGLQPYSA